MTGWTIALMGMVPAMLSDAFGWVSDRADGGAGALRRQSRAVHYVVGPTWPVTLALVACVAFWGLIGLGIYSWRRWG